MKRLHGQNWEADSAFKGLISYPNDAIPFRTKVFGDGRSKRSIASHNQDVASCRSHVSYRLFGKHETLLVSLVAAITVPIDL